MPALVDSSSLNCSNTFLSVISLPCPSIFRACDIRGEVGCTLTETTVYQIGYVLGTRILASGERRLVVAYDGRLSSPALFEALRLGVRKAGCEVWEIGQYNGKK